MPIVSGCLAVSQTLIVAHSSGLSSTRRWRRGRRAGAPAAASDRRRQAAATGGARRTRAAYPACDGSAGCAVVSAWEQSWSSRPPNRRPALGSMRCTARRATTCSPTSLTLLRDRAAAEDVTAQAFERAYRRQRRLRRRSAAPSARGCSASPATPRSTSCAGASAPPRCSPIPRTRPPAPRRRGRRARPPCAAPPSAPRWRASTRASASSSP